MRLATLALALALLAAGCGPGGAVREDTTPVRGPTLSIGGSVGSFVGHAR